MDFVIGHPRSGTMFVSQLINAGGSGREVAAHELLPKLTWSAVHEPTEYYAGRLDDRAIHNLLDIYALRPRVETSIDCCWKLSFVLKPLLAHFPDAKVVHLARDPRENVRSCMSLDYCGSSFEHEAYQTDVWRNHWLRWMPQVRNLDWSKLSSLERNSAFWAETHRLAFEALAGWPRVLTVRVEDLAVGRDIEALFGFLELEPPSAEHLAMVLASRLNGKADEKREVAALRGVDVARFEDWSASEQATLRSTCGAAAQRLGYALDPRACGA